MSIIYGKNHSWTGDEGKEFLLALTTSLQDPSQRSSPHEVFVCQTAQTDFTQTRCEYLFAFEQILLETLLTSPVPVSLIRVIPDYLRVEGLEVGGPGLSTLTIFHLWRKVIQTSAEATRARGSQVNIFRSLHPDDHPSCFSLCAPEGFSGLYHCDEGETVDRTIATLGLTRLSGE